MSEQDDRIIEDLLRRRREDRPPLGGPLCGDPELLAAFAEDALTGKPREEMEIHLAACAACREAVARLVRLAPREGTPALPAKAPPFWKRWAWAAPALAGIVLVGSFVMYNRERIVEQAKPAEVRVPTPPAVADQEPPAKPTEPAASSEPARRSTAKPRSEAVPAPPPAKGPTPAAGPFAPQPEKKYDSESLDKKQEADATKNAGTEEKLQVQAAKDQVQAPKQQQQATPSPSQQQPLRVQSAPPELKSRDDAARQNAAENAPATNKTAVAAPMLRSGAGTGGALASESKAKESAGAPGVVGGVAGGAAVFEARADKDSKKKVAILRMPAGKVLRIARFKDSDQAWALLADGRILVTQDAGENWKVVTLPERAAGVAAPDVGVGEFTGVSGRVYRSTDGGASWKVTSPR